MGVLRVLGLVGVLDVLLGRGSMVGRVSLCGGCVVVCRALRQTHAAGARAGRHGRGGAVLGRSYAANLTASDSAGTSSDAGSGTADGSTSDGRHRAGLDGRSDRLASVHGGRDAVSAATRASWPTWSDQ